LASVPVSWQTFVLAILSIKIILYDEVAVLCDIIIDITGRSMRRNFFDLWCCTT